MWTWDYLRRLEFYHNYYWVSYKTQQVLYLFWKKNFQIQDQTFIPENWSSGWAYKRKLTRIWKHYKPCCKCRGENSLKRMRMVQIRKKDQNQKSKKKIAGDNILISLGIKVSQQKAHKLPLGIPEKKILSGCILRKRNSKKIFVQWPLPVHSINGVSIINILDKPH